MNRIQPMICIAAASLLASYSSLAEEGRFTPTLGVAAGHTLERMRVDFAGWEQHEDRSLLNTRFFLGLSARLGEVGTLPLRSETALGYGVVHHTGHDIVELREAVVGEVELGAGFWIPLGLSAGLDINAERSSRSSFDLGLPFGMRYRSVDLFARPAYVIPLGSERSDVFTGTRELSARPGIRVVDFTLRIRLDGLSF